MTYKKLAYGFMAFLAGWRHMPSYGITSHEKTQDIKLLQQRMLGIFASHLKDVRKDMIKKTWANRLFQKPLTFGGNRSHKRILPSRHIAHRIAELLHDDTLHHYILNFRKLIALYPKLEAFNEVHTMGGLIQDSKDMATFLSGLEQI